jgi:putative transposase
MPRRPRSDLPDGVYHVTTRGTGGISVFVDDQDRAAFTQLLNDVPCRFGVQMHAWCLLGTHFHVIIDCRREQLSRVMHRLNGVYAQRFNKRHGRRGHVFEERYSAWLIASEEHLSAAIRYVQLNPVTAGLCGDAAEWMWTWPRPESSGPVPWMTRAGAGTVPRTRRPRARPGETPTRRAATRARARRVPPAGRERQQ